MFLGEELNTFRALSGKKVAKRVKMPISLLFMATEQDDAYRNLSPRLRFFPHGSQTEQTKDWRSPCRSLSPASLRRDEILNHPLVGWCKTAEKEWDCRTGMLLGMMGASEDCHPSQIPVPLCLHCCC